MSKEVLYSWHDENDNDDYRLIGDRSGAAEDSSVEVKSEDALGDERWMYFSRGLPQHGKEGMLVRALFDAVTEDR